MLLFVFLLPAIQVVFFCIAIGRDPTGLHLAIVNDEISLFNGTDPVTNSTNIPWFDFCLNPLNLLNTKDKQTRRCIDGLFCS